MNISSFTSASTIPSKLFCDIDLISSISKRYIKPVHIQINPSNKCPLNCSFCSCANRNREIEINYHDLITLTNKFITLGTKAVTITGGGDPLAYQFLAQYIQYLNDNSLKTGLVTNGILFKPEHSYFMRMVTWCRISLSDEYNLITPKLESIIKAYPINWSFSYVIKPDTKIENIITAINFANKYKFSHVRLVDNILDEKTSNKIEELKAVIKEKVDDSIVIYQGRKIYTKGHKRCLISLLKPNIGPDGSIMGCCGWQYRKNPPSLDFDNKDIMGNIDDIEHIWGSQKYYDGSQCEKCYYSDYNNILNIIWDSRELEHKEFI